MTQAIMGLCERFSSDGPENFESMSQCVDSGGHLKFGMCVVAYMEVGKSTRIGYGLRDPR